MANNDTSKPRVSKNKKVMLIRYGRMGFLGWFEHNETNIDKIKTKVIIKTARGLEVGDVVGRHCYKGGQFKCSCDQVDKYYEGASKDYPMLGGGTFVRYARPEDLMEAKHLDASSREELKCCQKFATEMNLPMKIIDAEHLLGGERIVIYFTSETRVDFRELVKRLAKEYQTRIELRQIGSRDEARLISDYESCGQECCCRRFLKILAPVNMRMAKVQKATLDPSKISGHCGRLKCCLRYEDETYRELKKNLPNRNTPVRTEAGEGRVIDGQILTQLVMVQYKDGKIEAVKVDEIEIIKDKPADRKDERQDNKKEEPKQTTPAKDTSDKDADTNEKPAAKQEDQTPADGTKANKNKRRRRRRRKNTNEAGAENNAAKPQNIENKQPKDRKDE